MRLCTATGCNYPGEHLRGRVCPCRIGETVDTFVFTGTLKVLAAWFVAMKGFIEEKARLFLPGLHALDKGV
ncbi:MAG: hypothetical protein NVS9B4_08740 [Candidatus Acidiferrum sp.]